ncbi:MAG: multidrug transporter ATP-binding protein, partial [Acidimicrobiales bacterium]|nr:multidrug transporter ATP-binding protein [Acidimicrobiales bacterium]
MLLRLLRTYLRNYRRPLAAVLGLQAVQAISTLYLPSLNARIIDKGVLTGDHPFIWRTGGVMLAVTLLQVVCATAAVYYGSKAAMGFGRDVRAALFHQVTGFSAREVGDFGAPSLITRITNDVQQVQMFVLMTCTLLIAAPITCVGGIVMALREDVGLSWILTVSIPLLVLGVGIVVSRMVPQFRLMQVRIDDVNQVLREQITGIR